MSTQQYVSVPATADNTPELVIGDLVNYATPDGGIRGYLTCEVVATKNNRVTIHHHYWDKNKTVLRTSVCKIEPMKN